MSQHRRQSRSTVLAPHVRRAGMYLLGLAVLAGGGLGLTLGRDQPASVDSAASVRQDERASRGQVRANLSPTTSASASPSPTAAPPATPTSAPAAVPPAPPATPAGCEAYTGNRLIGCALLPSFGFSTSEMRALDQLWEHESNWRHTATNPSSGAYGIPQALPATKMATAGADWRTNPATQIKWGLGYIKGRYGTPSAAWSYWQSHNWY